MMTLLRPRIREEDLDAGQRCRRNHRGDDFDGIVPYHAHVGEAEFAHPLQQAADARRVHLDAEEVVVRPRLRDRGGRLAHAESDLEHARRTPAEHAIEVDRGRRERDPERGQQRVEGAPLRRRHPPLAQHEAAHRADVAATSAAGAGPNARSRRHRPDGAAGGGARQGPGARTQSASASRRARRDRVEAPATEYSTATVSASFQVATASVHASRGRHDDSLRTPSRVTRHNASSLLHRRSQKSAVTSRARSGDSFGSAGSSDLASCRALDQHERGVVAVRDVEHDGVDLAHEVPEAVRAAAVDRFGVRERGRAGRIERNPERGRIAHGQVRQPLQLHAFDEAPAVRRVVGVGAELRQLVHRQRKGLRGHRQQHAGDERAARRGPACRGRASGISR